MQNRQSRARQDSRMRQILRHLEMVDGATRDQLEVVTKIPDGTLKKLLPQMIEGGYLSREVTPNPDNPFSRTVRYHGMKAASEVPRHTVGARAMAPLGPLRNARERRAVEVARSRKDSPMLKSANKMSVARNAEDRAIFRQECRDDVQAFLDAGHEITICETFHSDRKACPAWASDRGNGR